MPRPDFADITVVLDRSGSMESVRDDTIGGFNRFVEDQKAVPGDAVLTLVQFDNEYEFVHRAAPIKEVPSLDRKTFVPRGSTALLDAIGRAIGETGSRLDGMAEDARPDKVFFVIITDGHENASREFRREKILEMIGHQQSVYSWQFVFLGANQDAIQAGASIGVPTANTLSYASNAASTAAAFASVTRGVSANRLSAKPTGYFDEADRREQERHGAHKA
jgi:hypothetical protein